MGEKIFLSIVLGLVSLTVYCQAKKPLLMVVPSDVWCTQNNYVVKSNTMGEDAITMDYKKALQNDAELSLVISKIGELMQNEEFPLVDLNSKMKELETMEAEKSVALQDQGGISETATEKLYRVARADIRIEIFWKVNNVGFDKSITFELRGIDQYTNKQIAAASGTGKPSSSGELARLLQEAVSGHIGQFCDQLQTHFDDLFANGREVSLYCRRANDSDINYESEINGEQLGFLIEDWMAEHTQSGRFSTADATENVLSFNQVRIPLVNESGRALDTRTWARELLKYLNKLNMKVKLETKGLGQAYITLLGTKE